MASVEFETGKTMPYTCDMQKDESIRLLLDFDRWATKQVLGPCLALDHQRFCEPFDMGPGSLQKTITHILGAIKTWTQTLAHAEIALRLEADGVERTATQLLELVDPVYDAYCHEAWRAPLEEMTHRTMKSGKILKQPRREIFLHVVTHGMHHRAQCLNMMRKVGVTPLPASSLVEWGMTMRG